MTSEKTLKDFNNYICLLTDIISVRSLVDWDQETGGMPEKGINAKESRATTLEEIYQEKLKSARMKKLLSSLKEDSVFSTLDQKQQSTVEYWDKEYTRATKIPLKVAKQHAKLYASASSIWSKSKNANKFKDYAPTLEKIIQAKKLEAKLLEPDQALYNTLLDKFNPGMTTDKLDPLFTDLRNDLVPLLEKITKKVKANPDKYTYKFLEEKIDPDKFKQFCNEVLTNMGFDFTRGKLAYSAHPFTTEISSPDDVRITTQRITEELTFSEAIQIIGSGMHEAGHALVEQGSGKELERTGITGATLGIHESQSRLWEVLVGKGKPFWKYYFPKMKELFTEELKDVSFEEFYRAQNNVRPGFIRIAADEVTYNLHIMLRYEIEKIMIDGDEDVKAFVNKLPGLWNEKMQQYLGVTPSTDRQGVLQDIHWSMGDGVGYFPSYTIGNLTSVQIYNKAKQAIPDLEKQIEKGNLKLLKDWLTENLYKYGQIDKPDQIIRRVTGEPLNAKYFTEYLKKKYKDIYEL